MKGNDTGELHSLRQMKQIRILRSERDFGFYRQMTDVDKRALTEIHDHILDQLLEAVQAGECGMVVLDEITYPVNWQLLDQDKLHRLLALGKPVSPQDENAKCQMAEPEIVLTGRNPALFLQEAADYITEMRCVRHPYEKGIPARSGVEY